jgi:hypothetical protein
MEKARNENCGFSFLKPLINAGFNEAASKDSNATALLFPFSCILSLKDQHQLILPIFYF